MEYLPLPAWIAALLGLTILATPPPVRRWIRANLALILVLAQLAALVLAFAWPPGRDVWF